MSEPLRDWVSEDFGIDLLSAQAVDQGADDTAELWRSTDATGHTYAVKLSGGGTPAGLVLSAHLVQSGVEGIPDPVRSRDGRLWTERAGRRLSIMPWVSDHRAWHGEMTPAHWMTYGRLLKRLHTTEVTPELERLLPRETHTHPRFGALTRKVNRRLRTVTDGDDPMIQEVARVWLAADPVATVLEPADALSAQLRERDAPAVICHADPHLANVLLGDGDRLWLIDWDDAMLAPVERDLMFILGGVLVPQVNGAEQMWFFEGYGLVEVDPVRLAYYRCVRALEDAAGFAAQVLDTEKWPDAQRASALANVQAVTSPIGLATLARLSYEQLGATGK